MAALFRRFAAALQGYVNLEILDWLAELDSVNNLWDDEEIVVEDHHHQDVARVVLDHHRVQHVVRDEDSDDDEDAPAADGSDDDDDGIVADASDDEMEMEVREKYIRRINPRGELFCTTMAYVAINTIDGAEYYLCLGCYLAYQQRVDIAWHRHVDFHTTTRLSEVEREYCKSCRDPVFLIRPVEICSICNNNKKKCY